MTSLTIGLPSYGDTPSNSSKMTSAAETEIRNGRPNQSEHELYFDNEAQIMVGKKAATEARLLPAMECSQLPGSLTYAQLHHLIGDIHHYRLLEIKANRLLVYIFLILMYIALNAALLGANCQEQSFIEENYYYPFHMADFWGLFGFTLLEALLLIATEIVLVENILQTGIMFLNVVITFVLSFIFTLYPHFYEVTAHYLAYSTQILITSVNLIFLSSYLKNAKAGDVVSRLRQLEFFVVFMMVLFSMFQLILYGGLVPVAMGPERAAHFCEFTNEIVNGIFALMYAILIYNDVRQQLLQHNNTIRCLPEGP